MLLVLGERRTELTDGPIVAPMMRNCRLIWYTAFLPHNARLTGRGIHVMAIVTHGPRQFETNPPMDRKLEPGDQLIVSGTAELLRGLRESV